MRRKRSARSEREFRRSKSRRKGRNMQGVRGRKESPRQEAVNDARARQGAPRDSRSADGERDGGERTRKSNQILDAGQGSSEKCYRGPSVGISM